jgi:hypothetical protein
MKTAAAIVALSVFALTCLAGASGPESAGAAGMDRHPGHDVIWSQLPADGVVGWTSQFAPDYPIYGECAVDFVASEDTEITHIHWWGIVDAPDSSPSIRVTRTGGSSSGRPELDCSAAELRGCNIVIDDTNVGAPSNADLYAGTWSETGPEVVYMIQIPFAGTSMTAALSNMGGADLDIFLLPECDETHFFTAGDSAVAWTFAEPGIYYLVVEGYAGAESDYTLTIDCTIVPDVYFTIRFYADLPIERDRSVPGAMLYEHHTIHYNEAPDGWPYRFSYWADIPGFPIVKDERYWVSVQCVRDFNPGGATWYWSEAEDLVDNDSMADYTGFGFPRWTALADIPDSPGPTDLAFELADIETAVEARSWGVIKSLYR